MNTIKHPDASLALSPPLLDWLRADPYWAAQPARKRWLQRWQGLWNGVNLRLSQANMPPPRLLRAPLLILGPWRSGTTVMHELLHARSGWPTPQTWQCMNPASFRLGRRPANSKSLARPMDGLEIRHDSPQEDEFALLSLGVPSAYRAFLMPHRLLQLKQTLDQDFWLTHDEWFAPWEDFLRGVLDSAGAHDLPLILKSPNHSFRLRAILHRFPDARFVWMTRDAADVFESNRKMWTAMFAAHSIADGADPEALDQFLLHALDSCTKTLCWCMLNVPAKQWLLVDQQELHHAAQATVHAVWQHLGPASSTPRSAAVSEALDRTVRGRVSRYSRQLPADYAAVLERFQETQDLARTRFGLNRLRGA